MYRLGILALSYRYGVHFLEGNQNQNKSGFGVSNGLEPAALFN
jgi:hypothetical protein